MSHAINWKMKNKGGIKVEQVIDWSNHGLGKLAETFVGSEAMNNNNNNNNINNLLQEACHRMLEMSFIPLASLPKYKLRSTSLFPPSNNNHHLDQSINHYITTTSRAANNSQDGKS